MTALDTTENRLLQKIGSQIAEGPKFQDGSWLSLTQIFQFNNGQERGYGYRYTDDGWSAASFGDFAIMDQVLTLRGRMCERTGEEWQWCRITVVAPNMITRIDVAYDENPWKMGKKSLDMSDYAMSVRSEHHPGSSVGKEAKR